jgi:hypothetical protein
MATGFRFLVYFEDGSSREETLGDVPKHGAVVQIRGERWFVMDIKHHRPHSHDIQFDLWVRPAREDE